MEGTDLFRSLEGAITEEQWEAFKQMQKEAGSLVDNDDEDSELEDSDLEDISAQEIPNVPTIAEEEGSASEAEDEQLKREQELTSRYLNGELTFTEFSSLADEKEGHVETSDNEKVEPQIDEAEAFSIELEIEKERKKLRKHRSRRGRGRLPRDLEGLMGEANLCFARGRQEDAIKMCMEVVRLAPTAAEPFQTLGMLYEELGDMEKSLQFSLIAAHLSPNDAEEWIKLAELSQELGDVKQAITCYSKALKCDPENIGVHWERCHLYEQVNEQKKALEGYQQILQLLKPDQGNQCLQLARDIAKTYHEMGEIKQAISTMEMTFEKHPDFITSEDVNILLELQISQSLYATGLKILYQHCGIYHSSSENEKIDLMKEESVEKAVQSMERCFVPDMLPIDLRIKLIICLIHLKCPISLEELLKPLYQENLDEVGDLYLDVAEAYMDNGQYKEAEHLLATLAASKSYNLAAVWLKYGECLNSLGKIEQSADAYSKVVELAPLHMEARMSLSTLLQQLGKTSEALRAVTQVEDFGKVNAQLLYQRCLLLYSQRQDDEFLQAAKIFFSCSFKILTHHDEISAILNTSYRGRIEALRDVQKTILEDVWTPAAVEGQISADDIWAIYMKACHLLFELKRFQELQTIALSMLASPIIAKDMEREKTATWYSLLACYFNQNARYAYNFIRDIVTKDIDNVKAWNLFSQIVNMGQDVRHNKFCLRLMFKHPDNIALGILNGHNAMVAGSYKHSLGEYVSAFKSMPDDPLSILSIGLTFVHMACQKFAAKKHALVLQACAFLNQYLEVRGECQESFYNIGRAMHQLGILYAAVYYYKKALALNPAVSSENEETNIFDLKREIAFNLSLIYLNSGSEDLAAVYVNKYCVV